MTKSKPTKTPSSKKLSFGIRLKDQRKAKGLTQDGLAEVVNRSTEAISKFERGITYPTVELLIDLAEKLDTTVDFLLDSKSDLGGSKERIQLLTEATRMIGEMQDKPLKTAVEQLRALRELVVG